MNKGGFSLMKLIGVSAAKSKVSKKIGIPFTKSGRYQKAGKIATGGCLGMFIAMIAIPVLLFFLL
jgi:hypothetical protein